VSDAFVGQGIGEEPSPLLTGPRPPAFDLSGTRSRRGSERVIGVVLFLCAAMSVLTTLGIVAVLIEQAVEFFIDVPIWEFLFGLRWTALFNNPHFGVVPLVTGTLLISLIAMFVAIPLGLMSAIYLSEYAHGTVRDILKPALELLAGIPTIVYAFFALTFIRPTLLEPLFPSIDSFNALAAGLAVGIMIVPLIASLSEDAMRSVPRSLREGGFAIGATSLEVSTRIVFPAAFSGIVASCILAFSRAIGETMIVALAGGSKPQLTANPLHEVQAMTGYIVQVFTGDVSTGSTPFRSLFAVGLLLFVLTLAMNILSQWLVRRFREVYE